MRNLIVSNLMSLDGFFEGPNQELDWFVVEEEFLQYARELLRSVDTLVFGRKTYQHMADYWPSAPSDEIADKMNNLPKIVFSKTMKTADWNNSRLVNTDAEREISRLKQQPGKDMVIFGSAALASFLLQNGLIDEYRVVLQPVLVGGGTPMFRGIGERIRLKLTGTRSFNSGVAVLCYQKA